MSSSPPSIATVDAQDSSPHSQKQPGLGSPQPPPPISLSPDSKSKDRKSKDKDKDKDKAKPKDSDTGSAESSTRQRTSSNSSAISIGTHRHHHHSKSKSKDKDKDKDKASEDPEKDPDGKQDPALPTAAAAAAASSHKPSAGVDGGSTAGSTGSTRHHRHKHRSRDSEGANSDAGDDTSEVSVNDDNANENEGGSKKKKDKEKDKERDKDKDKADPEAEVDVPKEKSKSKDSSRKRSSSGKILPSTLAADPSSARQPVGTSSLATTSYSFTLGSVGNGNSSNTSNNGIIKSGTLAMKMDKDDDDDDDGSSLVAIGNGNGSNGAQGSKSIGWHEGRFVLYQDGTFDERADESSERVIFSGTVRSLKKMDESAREVIVNETRYSHFVKLLFAVPSGQGMIRQVAVDLGMKSDAELAAWVATFEACDTYILKPIKPVGVSSSSLSSLSTTAKSKREAKSEWAIKKSESSQVNFMVTKRGWVKYRGVMKQWSLRLFVLKPPMLIYFKDEIDESKEAAAGIINLHGCAVVKRESKKDGFCFKIYSLNEKHSIYASRGLKGEMLTSKIGINPAIAILRVVTQEEGLEWIRAIEEAIAYANFCQDGTFAKLISSSSLTCSGGGGGGGGESPSSSTTVPRSSSSMSSMSSIQIQQQQQQQQPPPQEAPVSVVTTSSGSPQVPGEKEEKTKKKKHKKQSSVPPAQPPPSTVTATAATDADAPADVKATVTYTEKDLEKLVSFQALKFLAPQPTPYALEVPREEMKIDAFEQGKNIILQLMKQVKPGMDLTKVTLPTHILEPRSFLEKMTDYFTHIELLSQ